MIAPPVIHERLQQRTDALAKFIANQGPELLTQAAAMMVETYRAGRKVLIFGNGGSAAEAQHFAAELVNRMCFDRPPLAAIALTTDTSILTSIANDYDFNHIFAKQLQALARPGDLAWGLSTSGRSENVLRALETAGEMGLKRLAMAGPPGTPIGRLCDLCLWVDAPSTPIIQEVHLVLGHLICEMVEAELFARK